MHDAYTPLVFFHGNQRLRALMVDNQPWFVVQDFAPLIGIRPPRRLLRAPEPYEQRSVTLEYTGDFHEDVEAIIDAGAYNMSGEGRQIDVVRWQGEVWVAWRDLPALMASGKEVQA